LPLATSLPALADDGEHNPGHCAYRQATTAYRFVKTGSGNELTLLSTYKSNVNSGFSKWNAAAVATTTFNSLGTTNSGGDIRVHSYEDNGDGNYAYFGHSCATPGGSYALGSANAAIAINRANFAKLLPAHRTNVIVHEVGHAVGLAHPVSSLQCSNPIVMTDPSAAYNCNSTYGPYTADKNAALRIKNPGYFAIRDTLDSGAFRYYGWQTEFDAVPFVGNPGAYSDRLATFDPDSFESVNSLLIDTNGQGGPDVLRLTFGSIGGGVMRAGYWGGQPPLFGDGLAWFKDGFWQYAPGYYASPSSTHTFGNPGDVPVMGDWNCDGLDSIGVFRPSEGRWYLSNSLNGVTNISFYFGNPGDVPIAGDWDPNSCGTEIGVVRGFYWYLRSELSTGAADQSVYLGLIGKPLLGDWDGNGTATPGVYVG